MKIFKWLSFGVLFFGLVGCSKPIEVDGEIFTTAPSGNAIEKRGVSIYFLTSREKADLIRLVTKLKLDQLLAFTEEVSEKRYLREKLAQQHDEKLAKQHDETKDQSERLELRLQVLKLDEEIATLEREGDKEFDPENEFDPLNIDFSAEEIRDFLSERKNVVSDSEGKFKVSLTKEKRYLILSLWRNAYSDKSSRLWFFEYIAEDPKLVLANSNSIEVPPNISPEPSEPQTDSQTDWTELFRNLTK